MGQMDEFRVTNFKHAQGSSNPATVEDALAVRAALLASGKSLTERVHRYGSAETIGMLIERLPVSIRATADLRATFEIHTSAAHLREAVEAAEHKHALDLQRLQDYAAESSRGELVTEVIMEDSATDQCGRCLLI
jgi:hypothetical protein